MKCIACGSIKIQHFDAEEFYDPENDENDEYYAFCECTDCGRRAEGWDEQECIDFVCLGEDPNSGAIVVNRGKNI